MPILDDLVALSNRLGSDAMECAILGEGNTSARVDADTFYVKGSGCSLGSMGAGDFVHLRFDRILTLMDGGKADEQRLKQVYEDAKVDPRQSRRPSVETLFHALCLGFPGINVVAHTHPTAINSLTCAPNWQQHLDGRLFPDEAVVLGRASVFVPYVDPGVILAKAIHTGIEEYQRRHGELPKSVYMQNHGFIALAANPTEAVNITMMGVKAAKIRLGALTAGGINRLPASVIDHLLARPDEKYRAKLLQK